MKCPACGAAEMVHDTRNMPYTYKGETTTIKAVTGHYCPACGEGIADVPESTRVMTEMLAFNCEMNTGCAAPVSNKITTGIITEENESGRSNLTISSQHCPIG